MRVSRQRQLLQCVQQISRAWETKGYSQAAAHFGALQHTLRVLQEGNVPIIEHPGRRWAQVQQPFSATSASRTYSAAPAAAPAASPPPQEGNEAQDEALHLTDSALEKLRELVAEERQGGRGERCLRLEVEAGGCSGFSYVFRLDDCINPDDKVFDYNGVKLATDCVSYSFVRGATIDYTEELIKSTFEVVNNPNAEGGCGCGSSFAPK